MKSPTRQTKRKASRRGEAALSQDVRILRDFIGQFIAEVDGLTGETVLRVRDVHVTSGEITSVQESFRRVATKCLNLTTSKP